MSTKPQVKPNKLMGDLESMLPHLQLEAEARSCLDGCRTVAEALDRLERADLLDEAVRLVAHALPARESVWWACACALHTSASSAASEPETVVRSAAEAWVRQPTDELRRAAMSEAERSGFTSPEAWAAVAAFWSGDSMAPPDAPKVPPQPHFTGLAVAGAVALAAVRGDANRRHERLQRFLGSAHDIAAGGAGRLEAETV